jgi:hypothetical protein
MSFMFIFTMMGSTIAFTSKRCINKFKSLSFIDVMISDMLCFLAHAATISFVFVSIDNTAAMHSLSGKESRSCIFCLASTSVVQTLSWMVFNSRGLCKWFHKLKL